MSDVTINQLAKSVGIDSQQLLEKVKQAGIQANSTDDLISPQNKQKLLSYLQGSTSTKKKSPITLTRKTTSTLSINKDNKSTSNPSRTVTVEVRKKRTFVPKQKVEEEKPITQQVQIPVPVKKVYEPPKTTVIKPVTLDENPTVKKDYLKTEDKSEKVVDNQTNDNTVVDKPISAVEVKTEPKNQPVKKEVFKKKERLQDRPRENKNNPMSRNTLAKSRTAISVRSRNNSSKVHAFEKPIAPQVHMVEIPETISVAELAKQMSTKGIEVIKTLMNMGSMATINQVLDQDTAILIVEELGHKYKLVSDNVLEEKLLDSQTDKPSKSRAPVVTIMGHVDHGKTSLLDYIRRSSVAASESGGITQHIGAYHVVTSKGKITFLDTPGHAAFTAMRARGAKATDIVIIVVAADDGVKPQTIEAIKHAQLANIPIIVAINKMDKPDANPDVATKELSQHNIMPESWGGDNIFVNISAKTGQNIDELLDSVLLQAEVLELKSPDKGNAKGTIIESKLDKGRGALATILVQEGELKKGDIVLAGLQYGRIKAILNENGEALKSAGPSIPAEIVGLSGVCQAGDIARVVDNEKMARELVSQRRQKAKDKILSKKKQSIDDLFASHDESKMKELNIVLKSDVHGSSEAIKDAIEKITHEEIKVNVVSSGVGGINESDVNLAKASNAILIGFNVRANASAKKSISSDKVQLYYYSIIYDLLNDVDNIINGMTAPKYQEKIIGTADVREVFKSPKLGLIAGCMVIEGIVKRNSPIRVLRDSIVIFEGSLESLRRFKEDANEVRQNTECGIGVKNYNDVKVGDQIEVFEKVEVKI